MRDLRSVVVAILLGSILNVGAALAEETAGWPQWGGPQRDGTVAEGFDGKEIHLAELWRRPADEGISALVVAAGRVVSLGSVDREDHVFALDARSGEELWRISLGERTYDLDFGASSTPATDGRSVFAVSPGCRLLALEAKSGKTLWERDLKADFELGAMGRGCWTSPLLDGRLLVVQLNGDPGRGVVALDKTSGEKVWRHSAETRGFRNSPSIAEIAGVRQVVVHDIASGGKGGAYGLRLEDGARLWGVHFDAAESYSGDSPIPLPEDRLAVVTWNDFRLIKVHAEGKALAAEPSWAVKTIRAEVQPHNLHAVYHRGHFYGFGGDNLVCLDAATGRSLWQEKIYPGSLVVAGGHLVVLSQAAGRVRIVEATPAGYHEEAALEVFNSGAQADTPPSVDGRRIFLRNSEEMVALEVQGQ